MALEQRPTRDKGVPVCEAVPLSGSSVPASIASSLPTAALVALLGGLVLCEPVQEVCLQLGQFELGLFYLVGCPPLGTLSQEHFLPDLSPP